MDVMRFLDRVRFASAAPKRSKVVPMRFYALRTILKDSFPFSFLAQSS